MEIQFTRMKGKLNFFAFVMLMISLRIEASISLGTCQLSCNQNEDSVPVGTGVKGPPGKRGPVGMPGPSGPSGPSGPPGECARCDQLSEETANLQKTATAMQERLYPVDCIQVKRFSISSGIYVVFPNGGTTNGLQIYCDQIVDGGGWMVVQRRMDGSENFFRDWDEYVTGFGFKDREFWLGLEAMYNIVANASYELRFDFVTKEEERLFAKYSVFRLASALDNYRITVTGYSGNAGDSMQIHNAKQFTTKDRDHDSWPTGNSAVEYKGAWWYTWGHHANLNGLYEGKSSDGMSWYKRGNSWTPFLKGVEMKIRRRQ